MATVQVAVPSYGFSYESREKLQVIDSFCHACSTTLDANDDIQFVHADGTQAQVNFICLNATGEVKVKGPYGAAATAVVLKLSEGGFHKHAIGWIYADGTDPALGIHVKVKE